MVRAVQRDDDTQGADDDVESGVGPVRRLPGARPSARRGVRRDVPPRRPGPLGLPGAARGDRADRGHRSRGALGGARPRLPGPGHHVLPLREGAAVPAGHRPPGHLRGRLGQAPARHRAAGPRAGGVPRRHLRRRRNRPRRRPPAAADHQLRALPAGRGPADPAQRRAHPRGGHRRRARRGGHLPGAGGQPPQPVGGVLRHGEPPDDGQGLPRPVQQAARAGRRRLLRAPPAGPARGGRAERRRSDGRGAHAGRLQLRVLRALAAGPADGRRAGRGARPVLPRQRRLHAHHGRRAAGRRDLPAHRRRVPRPAAVQPQLRPRDRGRAQRGPRGPRRDRQRGGQRGGRRQARLHLRAGHDRLLPQRETVAAQRLHVPLLAGGREGVRARAPGRAGAQAGRGLGRLRHPVRPQRERPPARLGPEVGPRRPARLDRPAGGAALDGAHQGRRPARAPPRRPAPLRGERRRGRLRAPRRPHPGRAAEGQPGGELQPGRRQQGHLGAGRHPHRRRRPRAGRPRAHHGDAPGARPPPSTARS